MEVYIGTIIPWAMDFAPSGWMFCQGQALTVQQNQALFSLLGFRFGGNGTTTFNLPDLRGRTPMGTANAVTGQVSGAAAVALTTQNIPAHNHTVGSVVTSGVPTSLKSATVATGNLKVAGSGTTLANSGFNQIYTSSAADTQIAGLAVSDTFSVANAGAGAAIPVMPPYMALNYIIATTGYYPPHP